MSKLRLLGGLLAPMALLLPAGAQTASRPELLIPQAHQAGGGGVRMLAATAGSSWYLTLGADETICVWNGADGSFLAKAPAKGVRSAAVVPKTQMAVLGDAKGGVRLVDVDTFTTVKAAALGSSVEWLQATGDGRLYAATYRGLFRVDAATLEAKQLAAFPSMNPYRMAMNEDGSAIAIDFTQLGGADRVVVYASADGAKRLERDVPRVGAIALSGDVLALGTRDSDDVFVQAGHVQALRVGDGSGMGSVAVKNASQSLLLEVHGTEVDVVSGFIGGVERWSLTGQKNLQRVGLNEVYTQLARVGGRVVAAGASGVPSVCEETTLRCRSPAVVQGVRVTQAQVLEDGGLLLIAGGDAIRLKDGLERDRLYYGSTLALVPQFRGARGVFAIAKTDDTGMAGQVNDALAPAALAQTLTLDSPVTLAASADGHYLAARKSHAAGKQMSVTVYDLSGLGKDAMAAPPVRGGWKLDAEGQFTTDASYEYQFAFTPDGKVLVAVNMMTGTVHRFDVAARREIMPVLQGRAAGDGDAGGPGFVSAWTLTGDGRTVVLGWNDSVSTVGLESSAVTKRMKLKAGLESLVGGDGGAAFLALEDGSLLTWDGQGEPTALGGMGFAAGSLVYVTERHLLLANAEDGSVHLLDAKSGEEQMALALFANGSDWLVWTPAGLFDASDRGWLGVRWKFRENTFAQSEPVEDFIDDYEIPGLAGFVLAGAPPKTPVLKAKERRTPTVRVVSSGAATSGKVNLSVEVTAPAGVTIQNVHLSRNGVLLKTWPGKQVSGTRLPLTADLVAGENTFTAYAFNQDEVKSVDATAEVVGPESLARTGELYVVAIGVNEYRNKAFALNYARQDALLAAGVLAAQRKAIEALGRQVLTQEKQEGKPAEAKYDQVDLRYSLGDAHVTTLVDGQATREAILRTIAEVAHRARAEDAVVIYFAGHGVAEGDRYYLLPQDFAFTGQPAEVRSSGLEALRRSGISDLDLEKALEGQQAAVSALILDACQSGAVLGETPARRGPTNSRGLAQMAYDKGMFILAAAQSTESAQEQAALEHGVLTYALVEEGLAEDLASPERNMLNGGGLTTLSQWLRWGAKRVGQGGGDSGARGLKAKQDANQVKTAGAGVQKPRLFAPPEAGVQVAVALRAIPIDPQTMTASGYAEEKPAAAAKSTAEVHAKHPEVLYPATELGYMRPGTVSASGGRLLAAVDNRVVTVDVEHGAVVSREALGGTLLSFDVGTDGATAALDQTGNVLVKGKGESAARVVVQGFGWNANGLVRWMAGGQILVVTDTKVEVHARDGAKVAGVTLQGIGVHGPVVTAKGDWLYLADASGKVLSFALPGLKAGPVWEQAGQGRYVTSLVVDPGGKHLLRIMSDQSFAQAQLPGLTAEPSVFAKVRGMYAAMYSGDGRTLYVADTDGQVQTLDAATGAVKARWPSLLDHADALAVEREGSLLVATGNEGMSAWSLPDGRVRSSVAGGGYPTTARFAGSDALEVMVWGGGRVRTFALPAAGATSEIPAPRELFLVGDRMMGMGVSGKTLWDPGDARKALEIPVAGNGRAALTPDARFMAWMGAQPPPVPIEVFETRTGKRVQEIRPAGYVNAFAISDDGQTVVYSSGDELHVGSGPALPVPQLPNNAMTLSSDGKLLLAIGQMGEVMVYDLAAKKIVRRQQTEFMLRLAAFSPRSGQVVLVTDDGGVLVWDRTSDEAPRMVGAVRGQPTCIAFAATGSAFVVASDGGEIGWFSLEHEGMQRATTRWLEATKSWLTTAADGRLSVEGDASTPLGMEVGGHVQWFPAAHVPGFTAGLLQELLGK